MAHLTKTQYFLRNENAAKRMQENAKVETLTELQHDALANLCTARHNIHSNMKHIIISDENGYKQSIITCNADLLERGLTPMSFVGTDMSDYIDIDSISEIGEDDYEEDYERISVELEKLNKKIENYLSEIDNKYGTSYCPTGKQRIF
jgi:hypothetical protein